MAIYLPLLGCMLAGPSAGLSSVGVGKPFVSIEMKAGYRQIVWKDPGVRKRGEASLYSIWFARPEQEINATRGYLGGVLLLTHSDGFDQPELNRLSVGHGLFVRSDGFRFSMPVQRGPGLLSVKLPYRVVPHRWKPWIADWRCSTPAHILDVATKKNGPQVIRNYTGLTSYSIIDLGEFLRASRRKNQRGRQ